MYNSFYRNNDHHYIFYRNILIIFSNIFILKLNSYKLPKYFLYYIQL